MGVTEMREAVNVEENGLRRGRKWVFAEQRKLQVLFGSGGGGRLVVGEKQKENDESERNGGACHHFHFVIWCVKKK